MGPLTAMGICFLFCLTKKHNLGGKVTETGSSQSHSAAYEGHKPL